MRYTCIVTISLEIDINPIVTCNCSCLNNNMLTPLITACTHPQVDSVMTPSSVTFTSLTMADVVLIGGIGQGHMRNF